MLTTTKIVDNEIELIPFAGDDDFEYLYDLSKFYRYHTITDHDEAIADAKKWCIHMWRVKASGKDSGCVVLRQSGEMVTLDAYIDPRRSNEQYRIQTWEKNFEGAIRTGQMAMKFFNDNYPGRPLFIYFDSRVNATLVLIEALGFIVMGKQVVDEIEYTVTRKDF